MKATTVEERRRALDAHREGVMNVVVPFSVGMPLPVKVCPVCHQNGVLTSDGRFVCRKCRVLFR